MSTIAHIGPRSHFRNRRSTLIGLLAGCVLASVAAHTMPGCSTYTKPDGSTVRAADPVKVEAATQTIAPVIAATAPQPFALPLASIIAALGTAAAAYLQGKRHGWTEAAGTPAVPGRVGVSAPQR
jgi:hypothetical protein